MSEIKPFTGVDDRIRLADEVPLRTPFTLNIFPSNLCNFQCRYCAQSLGREKIEKEYGLRPMNMSLDTVKAVVSQAKQFPGKLKLVSMMGHGEPLCNPLLPDMIRLIKEADIASRVDVITNASLLTHEYSDRLIEAGLDVLRVSLQGVTAGSYQETCNVRIDYESFLDNLSYFYSRKGQCKVYVKTMDVSLKDGEDELFYRMFESISDRMYIDKVKPVYDKVEYSESAADLGTDRYGNRHERRIVCPQPFYMLSVWPDGDVSPCDALYKANPLGNVHAGTLSDMWQSQSLKEFCHLHLDGQRKSHPACCRCCAPDDVAHEEDVLDGDREKLKLQLWRLL